MNSLEQSLDFLRRHFSCAFSALLRFIFFAVLVILGITLLVFLFVAIFITAFTALILLILLFLGILVFRIFFEDRLCPILAAPFLRYFPALAGFRPPGFPDSAAAVAASHRRG